MNTEELNLQKYKEFWKFCLKVTTLSKEEPKIDAKETCKLKLIQAYNQINPILLRTVAGDQDEEEEEE